MLAFTRTAEREGSLNELNVIRSPISCKEMSEHAKCKESNAKNQSSDRN